MVSAESIAWARSVRISCATSCKAGLSLATWACGGVFGVSAKAGKAAPASKAAIDTVKNQRMIHPPPV